MSLKSRKIHQGDCLKLMRRIDDGAVDLVFADPPFNIGYEYDQYDDRQDDEKYIAWCRDWMAEIHRVLKPNGTFWLAIGDEFAAELKVAAQRDIGFTTRSWVVWYYTFGVNCKKKFSRSHAHLFHFIKDEKNYTFNADDPAVRVPSARALVYGDKRANPKGRLPDDTWILRPQDFQSDAYGFTPEQDTWYFSRVAGTFKERQGFHGCQMPEQLLGRIIRTSSKGPEGDKPGELVLDPFAGSGTTLAVAKKLGREWLGCELSEDYVRYATDRLRSVKVGAPLDGPADPVASAPSTAAGVRLIEGKRVKPEIVAPSHVDTQFGSRFTSFKSVSEILVPRSELDLAGGIVAAYQSTNEGFSVDRVLADPELSEEFVAKCETLGVPGTEFDWKRGLMRVRKAGHLKSTKTRRTAIDRERIDACSFAGEIAWRRLQDTFEDVSLDEILCDPHKTRLFDRYAKRYAPSATAFELRWGALRIRKRAAWVRNPKLTEELLRKPLARRRDLFSLDCDSFRGTPGVYVLQSEVSESLYVGEALDIGTRIETHRGTSDQFPGLTSIRLLKLSSDLTDESRFGKKGQIIFRTRPSLNLQCLAV